jgi:transcriptional regulator with XRE-family HTH domain
MVNDELQAHKNEDESFLKALGVFLQRSRKDAGYKNANSFANVIGMSESQYRLYERGQANIKIKSLLAILRGLNKPFNVVFNFNNESNSSLSNQDVFLTDLDQENQVRNQVIKSNGVEFERTLTTDDVRRLIKILISCLRPLKKSNLLKVVGLSSKTAKFTTLFNLLINNNWIAMRFPDQLKSPNQVYFTTEAGKKVLKLT